MLHHIPFELQQLDQWVVATGALMPDGKRNKEPLNPRTGYPAKVTDRGTWGTFAEAQRCGYPLVGFVLSREDPYCIIDLDEPETPEQAERHKKILAAFESYSELSQSGKGIHIICRASIPHGVRRDKVEIYSCDRYMICTGNVYKPLPIVDCQELVLGMFHQMNAAQPTTQLVQIDGTLTDEQIYHMASTAANADKFNALWQGNWRGNAEWPSQSEADFALLSMLCFYTKDNAQVRRLFRWSGLVRDKSQEGVDGYLNRALSKIRAKELPPIDFSNLLIKHEQLELPGTNDQTREIPTDAGGTAPAIPTSPIEGQVQNPVEDSGSAGVAFPPGFIGELAEYFFGSAIRPVPEIALVSALALTAGVSARTYNISGSGLNQYLILIAQTGSGKEGLAGGIDRMVSAVRSQVPMVDQFIGPGTFASGQGLVRVLDKQKCFVSVLGEFGLTLKNICDPRASNAERLLKKVLLDIYAKSGATSVLRPSVYSETEKNTQLVQAPNVTILGESTPEHFYDALDATTIAEGLVPRLSIFEYDGARPAKNPHPFGPPPRELVDKFATLLATAIAAEQNRANCPVQIAADAQTLLDAFDTKADTEMRKDRNDINLQLWNRAHLKALKLAALVAVGINPHSPIVTADAAKWAISLTERDIRKLLKHFSAGDIGIGDERMEADLRRAVEDYLRLSAKIRREYGVAERILEVPVIPLGFLRRRLRSLASFRNHRLGANAALGMTLKSMCEAGELQLVPPMQGQLHFGINSPLYVKGPQW